jgi:3-deoxy-7-phosphoheptulonate synthase
MNVERGGVIMKRTSDLNVEGFLPLIPPKALKKEVPMTQRASETVVAGREGVEMILNKADKRLLVIVGPCSIHDPNVALEYAERLNELRIRIAETQFLVMRVYFEKPRTSLGWKGLINDPCLDGTCDIVSGLRNARTLLRQITELGLPTATEMLDPITPQYIADFVSWAAIGARTTESQTHREMASGLSMPIGFKNCTDGGLTTAANAMLAARSPQSFLGIDQDGTTCVVKTTGNPYTHLVLRGGKRPNYDSVSMEDARFLLQEKDLPDSILVDCSHANSRGRHQNQPVVWRDVIQQRMNGNDALIGMMLESNLLEGKQPSNGEAADLRYGVSITDECISWETTENLLLSAHETLLRYAEADHGTYTFHQDIVRA